jgi:hypothetical protein
MLLRLLNAITWVKVGMVLATTGLLMRLVIFMRGVVGLTVALVLRVGTVVPLVCVSLVGVSVVSLRSLWSL